jgi:hypothetical protein
MLECVTIVDDDDIVTIVREWMLVLLLNAIVIRERVLNDIIAIRECC